MKVTVNRKDFLHNAKLLASIPQNEKNDPFFSKYLMVVDEDKLALMTGPAHCFVVTYLDIMGEGDGECCVDFSITKLLKAVNDVDITMKAEKRMSLSGDKGFKGSCGLIPEYSPIYSRIKEWQNRIGTDCIEFNTSDLYNLCKVSLEFPGFRESWWVDITSDEEGPYGSFQQNEIGSIDRFPLENVTGEVNARMTFNPEQLLSQLAFCGERVIIFPGSSDRMPAYVVDPANRSWFGLLSQLIIKSREENA